MRPAEEEVRRSTMESEKRLPPICDRTRLSKRIIHCFFFFLIYVVLHRVTPFFNQPGIFSLYRLLNPKPARLSYAGCITFYSLGKRLKRHRSSMSFGLLRPNYFSSSTRA
ncbi:hypothetical protein PanWU01x14_335260 [Parasponia andersonii]|uniref:Transmembrane protein n=1 Tax=Parasponia andersonii TaxID=3476 RepID=A0A2P5AGA7_PARAD|nr:hypothetical protein PanWU01x14_335260 [Parasponia andersonii]